MFPAARLLRRTNACTAHPVRCLAAHQPSAQMPACDFKPPKYNGPSFERVSELRARHLAPSIKTWYMKPLLIHAGHMQWLFDHQGRRYLDMLGGIVTVSVGHCHPKVTAAATAQLGRLWHSTNIYMHPKIHEYVEKLAGTLPEPLKVIYLVNSGSEANDLAMLLSRLHTNSTDIVSLRNGYHGMSPYTMGLTALNTWRCAADVGSGVTHAMNPDVYQGIWGGANCRDSPIQTDRACSCAPNECRASAEYLAQLEEVFTYTLPRNRVASFFAESIQGVGGTVQFPRGYLRAAYELVRSHGGLCVADEVQTGFGRTGEHFWGFQGHGVVPDIVTMAKGIGNGYPLAAVATTAEIAAALTKATHFNTFGGNPVASAVGLAVLEALEEDGSQANSLSTGTYFLQELDKLRTRFPSVGDVRGKGLMIGVELVSDRATRKPIQAERFAAIWEKCKDDGVLLGRGGLHTSVFRMKPPMCVTRADVDFCVSVLADALQADHDAHA